MKTLTSINNKLKEHKLPYHLIEFRGFGYGNSVLMINIKNYRPVAKIDVDSNNQQTLGDYCNLTFYQKLPLLIIIDMKDLSTELKYHPITDILDDVNSYATDKYRLKYLSDLHYQQTKHKLLPQAFRDFDNDLSIMYTIESSHNHIKYDWVAVNKYETKLQKLLGINLNKINSHNIEG